MTSVGAAALEAARRVKLRKIQEIGMDPWGGRFDGHSPSAGCGARRRDRQPEMPGPTAR